MEAQVEKHSKSRIEIMVKARSQFKERRYWYCFFPLVSVPFSSVFLHQRWDNFLPWIYGLTQSCSLQILDHPLCIYFPNYSCILILQHCHKCWDWVACACWCNQSKCSDINGICSICTWERCINMENKILSRRQGTSSLGNVEPMNNTHNWYLYLIVN